MIYREGIIIQTVKSGTIVQLELTIHLQERLRQINHLKQELTKESIFKTKRDKLLLLLKMIIHQIQINLSSPLVLIHSDQTNQEVKFNKKPTLMVRSRKTFLLILMKVTIDSQLLNKLKPSFRKMKTELKDCSKTISKSDRKKG